VIWITLYHIAINHILLGLMMITYLFIIANLFIYRLTQITREVYKL